MSNAEIMDITKTCRSFPDPQSNMVDRENLIDTIDKIFEGDTSLLVIEGSEGIGKTALLAHFAKRHADRTFCLFIKPTSRLAYLPEYLRLTLSEQIHWALYSEILPSESVDESFLYTKLPILQREALASRKPFYFVVDGLADIPRDDAKIEDVILRDVLPLGLPGFKFLISGDLTQISGQLHQSLRMKSFTVPNFSLDETAKFFHDMTVDHEALLKLHRMCSGVPGHLAIVKRMIASGATPQSILDEDATNLPEFIGIEWRKLAIESEVHRKLLAVLAFAHQVLRVEDLARILNEDAVGLAEFVKSACILSVDLQTSEVQFVSEAHRKFAAVQLQEYRDEITQRLIDDLLTDVQSQDAVSYLPTYYEEANRLAELLDYLTPDHLVNLLSQSQSLLPVYRRTELGFVTAEKTDREGQLTKFSLQMAIVKELSQAAVWRAEIEARIGLQDYDAALALARNTLLREDRLHLLAKIARGMREKRVEPGKELLEQIRSLYNQVDPKTLGDRAVEIAADLIYSFPDLAVQLIEASSSASHTADRLDVAFAHLSVAALGAKASRPDGPDAAKAVESKIRDPRFHQFFVAASLLLGDLSAVQVIDEVEKMEFKNRVFFYRQWLLANSKRPDAVDVVETALDTLIKDGLYTPKTRDLLEIATPLPFVEDVDRARKLVGRLDSQKATVEHLSSSEDYVRLQLILAQTEQKYDLVATQNRVVEVYWFISNLDDLVVRTDCLAWLVTYLEEIDPLHTLESKEGIHSLSQEELKQSIDKILLITAEHSQAARGAVRALGTTKPAMALELANSLNTLSRRDEARQEFIERALEASWDKINIPLISSALDRMESSDTKDETVVEVFKELSDKKQMGPARTIEECLPLLKYIAQITDAHERTRASTFAYLFLTKQQVTGQETEKDSLLEQLETSWQSIDVGWLKVRTGFRIARSLAEVSNKHAHVYLAKTEDIRDKIIVEDESVARTYCFALRLVTRAYAGLLPRRLNSEEHIQRLQVLIDRLPTNGERAGLWADLAVRHALASQSDVCQRIVTQFVRPLIEAIDDNDAAYKRAVISYCAPALYYSHRITALEMIRNLQRGERDVALSNICKVILRKQPASDAYDDARRASYSPSYENLVDICDLLKLMEADSYIDHYVTLISDVLSTRKNRDRFTKQQKADLAFRLRAVAESKLPDAKNITHQGYRICCEAQIEKILQSAPQTWDRLMELARQVPNTADRALVLCVVGTTIPRKLEEKRRLCIDEAIAIVDTIPTAQDAADRYSTFADLLTNVDLDLAKKCLRRGMEVSVKVNDHNWSTRNSGVLLISRINLIRVLPRPWLRCWTMIQREVKRERP